MVQDAIDQNVAFPLTGTALNPDLVGITLATTLSTVAGSTQTEKDTATGEAIRPISWATRREVFKIDRGVLTIYTEIRAILKQGAQELGQWNKRHEQVGKGGGPHEVRVVFVDPPGADPARWDRAA
jgi:hypothetical protein